MSKRLLVFDRDDQGRFLLDVHGGTLTIGASAAEAEIVLRQLHVTRLHCEVEVDEDLVIAENREIGGAPHQLRLGATLHYGLTHLRFQAAESAALAQVAGTAGDDSPLLALDDEPIAAPSEPQAQETVKSAARRQFRFRVVDGADKGRLYALPENGIVTVGKSHKHADIVLNDLYVSRVHCELRVEAGYLVARHLEGEHGTLVDGQRVKEKELYLGAVLRVGNSHLKLECFEATDAPGAR